MRALGRVCVLLLLLLLGSPASAAPNMPEIEAQRMRCHWHAYLVMKIVFDRCYPEATAIRSALDEVIERLEGFLLDHTELTWREIAQDRRSVRLRLTDDPVSICAKPETHAVFIHLQIQGAPAIREWAVKPPAMASLPPLATNCY